MLITTVPPRMNITQPVDGINAGDSIEVKTETEDDNCNADERFDDTPLKQRFEIHRANMEVESPSETERPDTSLISNVAIKMEVDDSDFQNAFEAVDVSLLPERPSGASCTLHYPSDIQIPQFCQENGNKPQTESADKNGVTMLPGKPGISIFGTGLWYTTLQGEVDCPFLQTGSCKYGSSCRYNHPKRTSTVGSPVIAGIGPTVISLPASNMNMEITDPAASVLPSIGPRLAPQQSDVKYINNDASMLDPEGVMSCSTENCEFRWGNKTGVAGKRKHLHFYDSFTYEGEEYHLYDTVYLYKDGVLEPYIGKIVKIWEQAQHKKKVKVLWFFRPVEILTFLGDGGALANELFLASGDGVGLTNCNPLEAIAGKYNVVCISKDSRNPQPSEEELRKADYVFFRTFDVGTCTISDILDDKIAGVEVKYLFNYKGVQKSMYTPKLDKFRKEANGNEVASTEVFQLSSENQPSYPVVKEVLEASSVVYDRLAGDLVSNMVTGTITPQFSSIKGEYVSADEKVLPRPTNDSSKLEDKARRICIAEEMSKLKSSNDFGLSDDRPTKKARQDNLVEQSKEANFSHLLVVDTDKTENMVEKQFKVDSDGNSVKDSVIVGSRSEDPMNSKLVTDYHKKVKPDWRTPIIRHGRVSKAATAPQKNQRTSEVLEIGKRKDAVVSVGRPYTIDDNTQQKVRRVEERSSSTDMQYAELNDSSKRWTSSLGKGRYAENDIERDNSSDKLSHGHGKQYDRTREKPEAPRNNRSSDLCRHFLRGRCPWGPNCMFTHDSDLAGLGTRERAYRSRDADDSFRASYRHETRKMIKDIACRFFAVGNCRHGSSCRFSHEKAVHDRPENAAHDTLENTVHDTSENAAHDRPENAADRPENAAHDRPENAAHDRPENAADKPENAAHDRPENAAHDTSENAAHNRPENAAHDRPENAADRPENAAHDTSENAAHDTSENAAHDTPEENLWILTNSRKNKIHSNSSHNVSQPSSCKLSGTSKNGSSSSNSSDTPCTIPEHSSKATNFQAGISKRTVFHDVHEDSSSGSSILQERVPANANKMVGSALPDFLVEMKVETVENGLQSPCEKALHISDIDSMVAVKKEFGHSDELSDDEIDHMSLRERRKLLLTRSILNMDSPKNLKCLRKTVPSDISCNPIALKTVVPEASDRRRKRKKTATDSAVTALEEDAPGLLQVLIDQGIMTDEIKLYGGVDHEGDLDIPLEEDNFQDLESVVSKIFYQPSSLLKFAPLRCTKGSKPNYCLACLVSLVEQAQHLQLRKWPVEWGWCRDLQSFIFVFERHNRIVLERPEYGYATYFFELVDSLPINWQIRRLIIAMKLSSCSRATLIENKSLLVGEDLTEGEAKVLQDYGWVPNTGLGSMLNYCDRVYHDRKNDRDDRSEWKSKIGKMLMDGYDGGTLVLAELPKKVLEYKQTLAPEIKSEPMMLDNL